MCTFLYHIQIAVQIPQKHTQGSVIKSSYGRQNCLVSFRTSVSIMSTSGTVLFAGYGYSVDFCELGTASNILCEEGCLSCFKNVKLTGPGRCVEVFPSITSLYRKCSQSTFITINFLLLPTLQLGLSHFSPLLEKLDIK